MRSQVASTRTRDALGPAKEPSGTFGNYVNPLSTPPSHTQRPLRSRQQLNDVQEYVHLTTVLSG